MTEEVEAGKALDVQKTVERIPERLEAVEQSLSAASSEFELLTIHDQAAALQVAAKILRRREIQVRAAVLVSDAERAIARLHPPRAPGRPRKDQEREAPFPGMDPEEAAQRQALIAKARQAHSPLSDERYEALKERSIEEGEPLTRAAIAREAKKEQREGQPEPTEGEHENRPPPPTTIQMLRTRIEELEALIADLREKVALSLSEDQEARFDNYQKEIDVARGQAAEWQTKYNETRAENDFLKKKLRELGH